MAIGNGIDKYGMPIGGGAQRPNYVKRVTGSNGTGKVDLQNAYAQELVDSYIRRIQRNAEAMQKRKSAPVKKKRRRR